MNGATGLRLGAEGSAVRALCVLVHGRGQSPEDMESHIVKRLPAGDVAFWLPRAPRGAWYDARAIDPITSETGSQLNSAIDQLAGEIAALRAEFPAIPLVLAGFSQGACLSIEYACRGDAPPEALVAMTGCRVGTLACNRPQAAPRDLPVYLTGSDTDPWIPLVAMMEAAADLGKQGVRLRADVFPGRAHEALDPEVAMLASVLRDAADGRAPAMDAAR
jgi:phospholipase/carboxylesterase